MKRKDLYKLYTVKPSDPNDPQGIRQYYQRIIDAMPNNVYWLDRNCITLGCNRNTLRLIGLDQLEDFVGIDYEQMAKLANWTKGQAESFKKDDMEVMSKGQPKYNVEEPPLYDEHDNPVYYMSSRVPLFDEDDNVIGIVGISVDITERKKLEEKLRQTEVSEARFKAMSALGGMIAHELRTPLTALGISSAVIQQLLPTLIEGYEQASKVGNVKPIRKDRLEALKQSVAHMGRSIGYAQMTINTILKGFSCSDEMTQIDLTPFSLKEMLEKAIDQYPFDLDEGHLLTVNYVDNVWVLGEEQVIIQVIHNLFKNAFHAIDEAGKGRITVWTEVKGNVVSIYVEDTAKGIAPDQLNRIFEAFYTTKQTTAVSIGLGLYFCKMVLKKMGGDITCESQLGEYVRFKITLNLRDFKS